jgi:SanA protein
VPRLTDPFRRHPRAAKVLLAALALVMLLVTAANAYVLLAARGDSTEHVDEVPEAQTAIVLGAQVHADGRMSRMLADRVTRAAELWRAGKVERVLVSGDHGQWAYDEPNTMRKALVELGVPPRVIFEDHAGFDTWSTMIRAKRVFAVESAVIVTQGFHMARALFLADQTGLAATGLTSDVRGYGRNGIKVNIRELLSRVKAVGDAALDTDVVLGPPVPISGDDGSASWGPPPPPGTPPSGSPRP